MVEFSGEKIVPGAKNCEPKFSEKMFQEHIARYIFASAFVKGKRVLDVGCGVGYGAHHLAVNGAESVLAFDISADAINHARENYAHPNVEFAVASATEFDFGQCFDVVTCFELIEHVDAQAEVVRRIRVSLKGDGVLLMSTPRALVRKRTHFHTHEFSAEEFRALLSTEFRSVELYFENNHFTSMVASAMPQHIGHIQSLHDTYYPEKADYFIAVASSGHVIPADTPEPVLVVSDDAYVKLLEHDVEVLHQAEDRLQRDLEELRQIEREIRQQVSVSNDNIARLEEDLRRAKATIFTHVLGSVGYGYRILHKVHGYWRRHGAAATLRAVLRRIGSGAPSLPSNLVVLPEVEERNLADRHFHVVFMIGCWEGESKRYRVYNLIEGLRELGYRVLDLPYSELARLVDLRVRPDVVVLFRAPFDKGVGIVRFLNYAKNLDTKIVFDIDDYVFEPDIIDAIDGVRVLEEKQKSCYVDGVLRYRRLLERCDLVTVPTAYLKARVEEIGRPAAVIPNSINAEQIATARELTTRLPDPACVRIGYFSGSFTHQRDFAECESSILEIMEQYPQVVLRVVGYLELGPRWDGFAHRVERAPFQPPQGMLQLLAECDINIAPLELDNAYTQGKSELKFFEAGLVGVPTVASATDTFTRAITDGVDGYCVHDATQWRRILEALVVSPELRMRVGKEAKRTALERYSISGVAREAVRVYGLSKADPETSDETPLPPGRLRIAWVIPGLIIGGGGHRNILRAAYFLQRFGHRISLYFTGTEQDPETLKNLIKKHFYDLDCPVYLFDGRLRLVDVVFATHWSTVAPALAARGQAKEIMYFVQDFEPYFAQMGTEYVLAENTYRLGLYHITSGPWCERLLRRDFGAEADHFQFPVDRGIYHPRQRRKANRNIVYFAKPEMPRRCFELGVMALREVHRMCPDLEIVMFGSRHLGKQHFDFPVTIRGLVPTLEEIAQMYADGDVGLVFSTTNPSLIPYEMMACGLPVVDLDRGDNAVNYGGRSDIALLANPIPECMAQDIMLLLNDEAERLRRREAGLAFIDGFPSEEEMARRIEELILARLERSSFDHVTRAGAEICA
ncbi:methyltransferase domain-containing protein [Acidithiobacillus sp. AMEEHan]|uniref:rhamnosyltransferase WsaF family glycosyltransferase n=1 Tax=Acidithiobacillus sp. AMEEHan TaxID=2994951 RepID=UPI0027E40145|nr:methyltransferase domain-containing protein [Acidithiobacillus sp. AMEEHan]